MAYLSGARRSLLKSPAVVVAAFSPLDLGSKLKIWCKADSGVFEDAGTDAAEDADRILQWNDNSGNNLHLTLDGSSGPLYRTTGFNSKQCLEFVAGDGSCLSVSSFPMGTDDTASCFMAMIPSTYGSGGSSVGRFVSYAAPSQTELGANSCSFMIWGGAEGTMRAFQGSFLTNSEATLTASTFYRMGCVFSTASSSLYKDNVAQGTPDTTSFNFNDAGTISLGGTSGGTNGPAFKVAELLVLNSTVTSDERSNIHTWLARWA